MTKSVITPEIRRQILHPYRRSLLVVVQTELEKLARGDVTCAWAGICGNLQAIEEDVYRVDDYPLTLFVAGVSKYWDHCSKNPLFPVTGTDKRSDGLHIYTYHQQRGTLWKGRQRNLRMSLAQFLLDQLTTYLQETDNETV